MKNTQPTLCTVLYTTTTRWIFNSALMIFFCFVIYILLLTSRLLDIYFYLFFIFFPEHVQLQFWIGKCRLVRIYKLFFLLLFFLKKMKSLIKEDVSIEPTVNQKIELKICEKKLAKKI